MQLIRYVLYEILLKISLCVLFQGLIGIIFKMSISFLAVGTKQHEYLYSLCFVDHILTKTLN